MVFETLTHRYACPIIAFVFMSPVALSYAQEYKNTPPISLPYSTNITGQIGLNTIPSARVAPDGTAQIGVATADPYLHSFLSFQIAEPLNVTLRQTSESSSLLDDARRLYPGLDFKLRLVEEGRYTPAIAIGAQSAVGHSRMAGEYIAASKRYHDFDFTAGIGWGRYGSAAHFKNPLKGLSSHFGNTRPKDNNQSSGPQHWFTGDDVGLFAGIEYFTPIDGLSVKGEYGADDYTAAQAAFDYNAPSPWSVSLNYKANDMFDVSLGTLGGEKVMARLSMQGGLKDWGGRPSNRKAENNKAITSNTHQDSTTIYTQLALSPNAPTPQQVGHATRTVLDKTSQDMFAISVTPYHMGLRGPNITIMKSDFENAISSQRTSPQEIWHNASIINSATEDMPTFANNRDWNLRLILDNDISLSEEDTGVIYRTALLASEQQEIINIAGGSLQIGGEARFNIKDNLHRLQDFRQPALLPVRSDIDAFTDETFAIDRAYLSYLKTLRPNLHAAITAGYIEEMFAGLGGEILYRPYDKPYAIGAEAWQVIKRAPKDSYNLGLTDQTTLTGHLNAYYEFGQSDVHAFASIGKYLADDYGGEIGLHKTLNNGVKISALARATNKYDVDVFGADTHIYSGISMSVPIGNIPYIGEGSAVRVNAYPIGRDAAQRIDQPNALYEASTPLSYRHITRQWNEIVN